MADIAIRNVKKDYGKTAVVHGVDLEIRSGEFIVILGPSGCGKSTLLRMVAGLEAITSGEIAMDGKVVNDLEPRERGCAMVFQNYALYPHMSVAENIGYALKVAGVGKAERLAVARDYVELVGLSAFGNSYPHELSGGMQQRVGIARALAINPTVLLMDEPYGALDVQTRELLQDELLDIWEKQRKTVIFVTHSIEEALYLADRIVVMSPRPGRIEQVIEVPFARPRRDELKSTPEFLNLRREIWQSLKKGAQV